MPDAIIVGGGIAGLACAIALKRADWNVEVFDAGQAIADPTSAEELDSEVSKQRQPSPLTTLRFVFVISAITCAMPHRAWRQSQQSSSCPSCWRPTAPLSR